MAFIKCPECGKEINNAIGQCPDCEWNKRKGMEKGSIRN